jgi:Ca-activated chloride channel family protein
MTTEPDYYEILGLDKNAKQEDIRQAYREASRRLHPDVNKRPGETELFLDIQEAYSILSDNKKRAAYDADQAILRNTPVDIKVQCSVKNLSVTDEPQLVYLLVDIRANVTGKEKPLSPLNLCLVLDRSTSMQGERMDTLKSAAIELVRQLESMDYFSIVTFNDRADVLIPVGRHLNRLNIETSIRMMRSEGGTEIFKGLEAGYSELNSNLSRSFINHMILVTDGQTYGDEDNCLAIAEKAASQGITISGLGIGTEWNDDFMDELTTRTGGGCYFISEIKDLRSFLQEKFLSLKQSHAERVILNLETIPGVTLKSAFRLTPDAADLPVSSSIRLGSLARKSKISLLIELVVKSVPEVVTKLTILKGDLSLVLSSDTFIPRKHPVKFSRYVGGEAPDELPPTAIFQAVSQVTLYRMQERARQEVAEGKAQEASLRLQRLATQLFNMGESALAETALIEAERIQQTNLISAEGKKVIKFGTRKLLLPSEMERED